MLLSKDMQAGGTISVSRRTDADGKDEDHLFFDFVAPASQPKSEGDKPATAGAGST